MSIDFSRDDKKRSCVAPNHRFYKLSTYTHIYIIFNNLIITVYMVIFESDLNEAFLLKRSFKFAKVINIYCDVIHKICEKYL